MIPPAPAPIAPTAPAPHPAARWAIAAGLLLAALVVHHHSLSIPFIFDDRPAIERNESIRQLWPLTTPLAPPVTSAGAAGRPLVNLSLALNYAVGGLDPRGYHLVNVLAHALTGLLWWGLLRRTFARTELRGRAESLAGAAALGWLVHPLQTETVACIVQRNEIFAAFFLLLTLYGLERSVGSARSAAWQGAAVAACLLGMASKEVMATAPLVALLYDRAFLSGSWAGAWRRRGRFYAALAGTWLLLAGLMLGHEQRAGTVGFGLGVGAWPYLLTQCEAVTTYLKLVAWPHPLIVDYGTDVVGGAGAVWGRGLFVLGLLGTTVFALWRRPAIGTAAAGFFLLLAPSSSFVPLTTQPIAEHRMYLPLATVLVLLTVALHRALRRPWLVVAPAALALALLTHRRLDDYQSESRLWRVTLAQRPENARAHASLAGVFVRNGQWAGALPHYEATLRLRPDYADAQNDYALALARSGRPEEALQHYELAWRLKPDDLDIRSNLGRALVQAGRAATAIPHLQAVVARDPRRPTARNQLGDALLKAGRTAEALEQFEAALRIDPNHFAAHNNAAVALGTLGRPAEALTHFATAARLEPGNFEVQVNLGDALLRAGRALEATAPYTAALRLQPTVAALHYNLGNVWLQLDRTTEAVENLSTALRLQPGWAAAQHNLALALTRAGRAAEAIPLFEQVLRQLPTSAQAHHNFALALAAAGRTAEAMLQDETALRLAPGLIAARRHLEQLRQP